MTDKKEDGGPADEMTLRDYFAGQALFVSYARLSDMQSMAEYCYSLADAMLEARKK